MRKLLPEALSQAIAHWLERLPRTAATRVLADAGPGGIPIKELRDDQLLFLAW